MIKITLVIAFVFAATSLHGQSTSETDTTIKKFYDSLLFKVFASTSLRANFYARNACVPVICLVKINIDKNGHVSEMSVSDSADSVFKAQFNIQKPTLNIADIEAYAQSLAFTNKYFIIPIFYSYIKEPCSMPPVNPNSFTNYTKFNGELIKDECIFLEPLTISSRLPKQQEGVLK